MPDTAGWVEHVSAEITLTAYGGLRPVEIILYERPKSMIQHDDSHRECTIPMVPEGAKSMPDRAVIGKTYPTDARLGSHQAAKSMRDHRRVTGPYLFSWSAWSDAGVSLADNAEGDPETISSTTFVDLKSNSITSYNANNPGWSISSGGTARNLEQSGPLELRGVTGCIPVIVRAYCKVSSGIGTIRFQTAFHSLRDLTTSSTSYVWLEGLAWLRCGVHQTQATLLEVFGKTSSAIATLSIRYLSVEHYGNYEVTE